MGIMVVHTFSQFKNPKASKLSSWVLLHSAQTRALNLVQHPLQVTVSQNQEANENFGDCLEQYLMN